VYDLGQKMIDALLRDKVTSGDVISIDKASGKITKLGRSHAKVHEYEVMPPNITFVNTPEGELQQRKDVVHRVSMHEIDVINSRAQGFLALFTGDTGEIGAEVREQINGKISDWRHEGKAEIVPGVLFIDEVHMLDIEAFAFLKRALESEFAPIVVMASNRGYAKVRGTSDESPHGLPADLLDRLLVIHTEAYSPEELREILKIRAQEEAVELEAGALELLSRTAHGKGVRYAMHLIVLADLMARREKKSSVGVGHVRRAHELFIDPERSSSYLNQAGAAAARGGTRPPPQQQQQAHAEDKMDLS